MPLYYWSGYLRTLHCGHQSLYPNGALHAGHFFSSIVFPLINVAYDGHPLSPLALQDFLNEVRSLRANLATAAFWHSDSMLRTFEFWYPLQDSNPHPKIRSLVLYPVSLRRHIKQSN
jgi:hypothetical protein